MTNIDNYGEKSTQTFRETINIIVSEAANYNTFTDLVI